MLFPEGHHPSVATKVLKRSQYSKKEDFMAAVKSETEVLQIMKRLDHAHLIKTIAYYRKGDENHLLFP